MRCWFPVPVPSSRSSSATRFTQVKTKFPACIATLRHAVPYPQAFPAFRNAWAVIPRSQTEQPQIRKLMSYWDNKEPIPWIKVHDLPDFVHFTHKRHISAGIECQTCHGPVETMERIRVTSRAIDGSVQLDTPWEMGLCLNCHKQSEVENGTDCWTCHK